VTVAIEKGQNHRHHRPQRLRQDGPDETHDRSGTAQHGEVYFKGQADRQSQRKQLAEIRRQYGFCFQMSALFDSLTVYEKSFSPSSRNRKPPTGRPWTSWFKSKLAMVGMDGFQHSGTTRQLIGRQKNTRGPGRREISR